MSLFSSAENITRALKTADSLKLYGARYSWFVGTKTSDYSLDVSCCADMKVLTFHPQQPTSSQLAVMKAVWSTLIG